MYEKIPKIINLLFSMFNSVGKGVNTNYRLVYPRFQFCEGKTGEKMFVRFRFVSAWVKMLFFKLKNKKSL